MAQIKSVKYGIINNEHEKVILKKMGVLENNIYHWSQMNELFKNLFLGDVICVATVKSISVGAYDLFRKLQYLANKGVDFTSSNERYLNFSSINAMKDSTKTVLQNKAQREYEFISWIQKCSFNNDLKQRIINRIQWENITDIVMTFHSNGIKKR